MATQLCELPIASLAFDTDVQCREALRSETVGEYREAAQAGAKFPPLVVFYDGKVYWVADGFHRGQAFREAGLEKVPVDIRTGTKRDAILFAVGANASHGLRRTNADKRRAVETLLRDSEWSQWSDRELARRAGVSNQFVANLRPSLSTVDSQEQTSPRKCADGRTINVSNIGKPKAKPDAPKSEPRPSVEEQTEEVVEAARYEAEEDLTENGEAEEAIRIAKTAVETVWNRCPAALRWRLKASIENHLADLAEGG